ncbi:MAG: mechanosensitive ion channel family protein [Acidiferrobacterales bacterium]|nr:mechanosensitive ion channel family protein [Acidiferrobacterales bacterium]
MTQNSQQKNAFVADNTISSHIGGWCRNAIVFASILMIVFAVAPNFAQDYSNVNGEPTSVEAASTSPTISKQQIRETLLEVLSETSDSPEAGKDDASSSFSGDVSYDQSLISDWDQTRTNLLGEKLARLVRKFPDYPKDFKIAMGLATSPEAGWTGARVALTMILVIALGLIIEQFTTKRLLQRLYRYVDGEEKSLSLKFKFIFVRIIIQLIGVAVLALVTYSAVIYFRNDNRYFEFLFNELVAALIMYRLWMILLRNIFSPKRMSLRPVPLDDHSAGQLHNWFLFFFFIIEFGNTLFAYLTKAGMSEAQLSGLLIPYTFCLNLTILSQVWSMRKKITGMFITEAGEDDQQAVIRDFLIIAWPFVFTAWLLVLWVLWLYKAFMGEWEDAGFVSISWWITLAFFVADRIFYGLIKNVDKLTWLDSPNFAFRSARFIRVVQTGFRLLMVAFAVYMLSLAWGLSTGTFMQDELGSRFISHGIDLLVIATVTYIIWEFFNAVIERQLPKEMDALEALEGEGGGAGATRAETLLPMTRSFLTVILVTFVILSVLNSLGIAITPLLAGAGVVGIAVGFGAQKLVQDVLSGIFFLIDDAFRKHEYIEIEELRGTVEKISLRSMQLRHHLGAVQTIPYGEIKTVKNLSRDWVTMKLELRLSYDTDIEQVRKIIKKVGQQMMEDPELGPSFILPLKSQGVMRVEESALIVRMKFTTKPGEQWVIRREAYRKVRDALAAANIFFAHREVRVRLPDDQTAAATPEQQETIRETVRKAGAAAASAEAEDAQKQGKINFDDDM